MYGILVYVWDICLMYVLVLCFGKNEITCHPGATMAECIVLCMGYWFYAWDICLMYGILVLCLGYLSYVWDTSLRFWKTQNHVSPGCNYGGVYCLMFGILVLCMGY